MDAKSLKDQCIDAFETFRDMPDRVGPSSAKTCWPEYALDYPGGRPIRLVPSAQRVQAAERFIDLVNRRLPEADRKDLWKWARLKVIAGRTIKGHCDKFGLKEHNYRRHIDKIFQKLAGNRKSNPIMRQDADVDGGQKIGRLRAQSDVTCTDGIKAWRPESSKPVRDPNIREIALGAIRKQRVGP